jgi:hypothetical protein
MIVVIGCGRSGTNMVLEILRGNTQLQASKEPENKNLFRKVQKYSSNYLTKCDTCYFDSKKFQTLIELNDVKFIWTIRDPWDMILSKIKRGQPISKGGDGSNKVSDDATPEGCLEDIFNMFTCYKHITTTYPNQILVVKMEDIINSIKNETKKMCHFLDLKYDPKMLDFVDRMRNKDKKKRYKKLDKNQIGLWKRRTEIYNGFFKENKYPLEELFEKVKIIRDYFGYF